MSDFQPLLRILPEEFRRGLEPLLADSLYEVRIRCGQPAVVRFRNRWQYLARYGTTEHGADALRASEATLGAILLRASDYSLYTVNRQLCESYVTIAGGVRIGVCGEPVLEAGKILTVKNFNALVIRIPHEVNGASKGIPLKKCSTLIVGAPGSGKTTFLRDYAKRYSECFLTPTVIVDERAEISACVGGVSDMDVGLSETMSFCDKRYGFRQALRVLRPEMLVTDELSCEDDIIGVRELIGGGVCVTASVHARTIAEAEARLGRHAFDRIVLLDDGDAPGVIKEQREVAV